MCVGWELSSEAECSSPRCQLVKSRVPCDLLFETGDFWFKKKISHVNSMCGAMGLIPHITQRKAHKAMENEEDEGACLRSDR